MNNIFQGIGGSGEGGGLLNLNLPVNALSSNQSSQQGSQGGAPAGGDDCGCDSAPAPGPGDGGGPSGCEDGNGGNNGLLSQFLDLAFKDSKMDENEVNALAMLLVHDSGGFESQGAGPNAPQASWAI